jgi:glycine dehydrogenase
MAAATGIQIYPSSLCRFAFRHNSASEEDVAEMVKVTGFGSMEELIDATVPKSIKRKELMDMGKYTEGFTESGFLSMFK